MELSGFMNILKLVNSGNSFNFAYLVNVGNFVSFLTNLQNFGNLGRSNRIIEFTFFDNFILVVKRVT